MTSPSDAPRDWQEALADRVWARWRWLVVAVALIFALNSLAGLMVGAVGALAFAGRVSGRVLRARKMVQEVRRLVADPDDSREGAPPN